MFKILLPIVLAIPTLALYSSNFYVINLTLENFDKLVINSDEVWVVEFFAPWCGYCQKLVPEYQKAAKGLKGVIKVGAINVAEHNGLGARFGVSGFPAIKIFGVDKHKPEDFNGERTAEGIVEAALRAAKNKINAQLGKATGSSGGGKTENGIELTDSNFDKLVLKSEDMWLVLFFAPWCGHCKNLAPHWAQAASQLKGKLKLGALDATVHTSKASEYGVQGYPTIKFFAPGGKVSDYSGGRTASDIVAWALEKQTENLPAPELEQIVDADSFQQACDKQPLCVIAFLPQILDCQADCRRGYLKLLKDLGEKYKNKLWGWVWSEAGSQSDLENAVDVGGFGYPAMVVINAKKMKYSLLRGSFSKVGINEFLRDLSYGRGNTALVKGVGLPKIVKTEPWNGKDGELPAEENIDLSDVDLDVTAEVKSEL